MSETKNKVSDSRLVDAHRMCLVLLAKFYYPFEYTIEDLKSKKRDSELIMMRSLVSKILLEQEFTLSGIGDALGGRTHATVINLLKFDTKKQGRDVMRKGAYSKILEQINLAYGVKRMLGKIEYHEKQIELLKKELEILAPKNLYNNINI